MPRITGAIGAIIIGLMVSACGSSLDRQACTEEALREVAKEKAEAISAYKADASEASLSRVRLKWSDQSQQWALCGLGKSPRPDIIPADDADRVSMIAALEQKVAPVPASDAQTNLRLYKQLLMLAPENSRYRQKVEAYASTHSRADPKPKSLAAVAIPSSKCAENVTDWLTHNAAKRAIKDILKAPRTARFSDYRTAFVGTEGALCIYAVRVTVDSQNGFGAMLRSDMTSAVTVDPQDPSSAAGVVIAQD